jgi:hypothetical protein
MALMTGIRWALYKQHVIASYLITSEDRIPLGGPLGPPNLLSNVYRVSFPRVKRPRRDVDHLPASIT